MGPTLTREPVRLEAEPARLQAEGGPGALTADRDGLGRPDQADGEDSPAPVADAVALRDRDLLERADRRILLLDAGRTEAVRPGMVGVAGEVVELVGLGLEVRLAAGC